MRISNYYDSPPSGLSHSNYGLETNELNSVCSDVEDSICYLQSTGGSSKSDSSMQSVSKVLSPTWTSKMNDPSNTALSINISKSSSIENNSLLDNDDNCLDHLDTHQFEEQLNKYPSGREPLVSIDLSHISNKAKVQQKPTMDKEKEKESDAKDLIENFSWISRTLCIMPSNLTLDTVDEGSGANNFLISDNDMFVAVDTKKGEEARPIALCTKQELQVTQKSDKNFSLSDIRSFMDRWPDIVSPRGFFQSNNLVCNNFQDWYDDSKEEAKISSELDRNDKKKTPLTNSSNNPVSKKEKIKSLRLNISPFDVDGVELIQGSINMNKYSPVELDKQHFSFSKFDQLHSKTESSRQEKQSSLYIAPKNSWYEYPSLTTCGQFDGFDEDYEEGLERSYGKTKQSYMDINDDDSLCYDSDPSDMMTSPKANVAPKLVRKHRRSLLKYIRANRRLIKGTKRDENMYLEQVCEHMSAKKLLVWHRKSLINVRHPPLAIHAWIDHGTQLDVDLIQPKFSWQETQRKREHSKSVLSNCKYHSVDLLDICKVIPLDRINVDRHDYPFVRRSCSFLIQACDLEMVFEARNDVEKDYFVEGLKMVVARLGTQIIMGDGRVLEEFFSPMSSAVPGGFPSIV